MKDITVRPSITIRQAMKKLNQVGEKCLIITDEENNLLGTLSDGDLRKAILNGKMMGDDIAHIFQRRPTALHYEHYELSEARQLFTEEQFDIIPLVDDENQLKDVLHWKTIFDNKEILNSIKLIFKEYPLYEKNIFELRGNMKYLNKTKNEIKNFIENLS